MGKVDAGSPSGEHRQQRSRKCHAWSGAVSEETIVCCHSRPPLLAHLDACYAQTPRRVKRAGRGDADTRSCKSRSETKGDERLADWPGQLKNALRAKIFAVGKQDIPDRTPPICKISLNLRAITCNQIVLELFAVSLRDSLIYVSGRSKLYNIPTWPKALALGRLCPPFGSEEVT